jgi:hypothetical protein
MPGSRRGNYADFVTICTTIGLGDMKATCARKQLVRAKGVGCAGTRGTVSENRRGHHNGPPVTTGIVMGSR